MARRSLLTYSAFTEEHEVEIGFRRTGMLFVVPASGRDNLERNVVLQRSLGVDARVIAGTELAAVEPRAHFEDDVIAAWEPEAGYVDPLATVHALATVAVRQGLDLRQGEGVAEVLTEGDRITGVSTTLGATISSPVVINTGGPWSGPILARLGVELPLQPVRPEQAFFELGPDFGGQASVFGDLVHGVYWKPEPKGWTRVGKLDSSADAPVVDPDHYDEGVSDVFIRHARNQVARRLPRFAEAISWGGCGALYTMTPDSHPVIGAVPGPTGLFVASGFSGHGFKLAPAVGAGLASLVLGETSHDFSAEFFAADRFDRGRPITSAYEYGILG